MTSPRIERWDVRRDGPLSELALQRKVEALGFVIKARTYPAGFATPAPADEQPGITAVVSGLVRVTIEGDHTILSPGDMAFLPPRASRSVEAVGPSPALCLEAVPRSEPA
jgi:hypothetical protein